MDTKEERQKLLQLLIRSNELFDQAIPAVMKQP